MITLPEILVGLLIIIHLAFLVHAAIIAFNWIRNKDDRECSLVSAMIVDNFVAVPILTMWALFIILIAAILIAKFLFH